MSRRPPAVARVLERVTATAREHDMFSEGDRVLVAVSGGPDSTCLLYSLHMLRRLFKIELEVFHFDHGLRADSAKDAQYVKRLATKLKVPFHLREADSKPAKGESVEAWARAQRLGAAASVGTDINATRVAFGHTVDDQAETVLIALIRGGGLEAVAGIRAVHRGAVRPLLHVRRKEVTAFCRALGVRPRVDPTNRDRRLLRNAVRLDVIPAMEKATGRDVRGPIARTATLLQREVAAPTRQASPGLDETTDEGYVISANGLTRLTTGAATRLVKDVLLPRLGAPASKAHVDAVLDLARGRPGRRVDLPGGFTAVREKEYIRLSRTSPGDGSRRKS